MRRCQSLKHPLSMVFTAAVLSLLTGCLSQPLTARSDVSVPLSPQSKHTVNLEVQIHRPDPADFALQQIIPPGSEQNIHSYRVALTTNPDDPWGNLVLDADSQAVDQTLVVGSEPTLTGIHRIRFMDLPAQDLAVYAVVQAFDANAENLLATGQDVSSNSVNLSNPNQLSLPALQVKLALKPADYEPGSYELANGSSPMLGLNQAGNGLLVYQQTGAGQPTQVYLQTLRSYAPESEAVSFTRPAGWQVGEMQLSLNQSGQGLLTWSEWPPEAQSDEPAWVYAVWLVNHQLSSEPFRVDTGSETEISPHVAIAENGRGLVIWAENFVLKGREFLVNSASQTWVEPAFEINIADYSVVRPVVAVNESGDAMVAYRSPESQSVDQRTYTQQLLNYRPHPELPPRPSDSTLPLAEAPTLALALNTSGHGLLIWNRSGVHGVTVRGFDIFDAFGINILGRKDFTVPSTIAYPQNPVMHLPAGNQAPETGMFCQALRNGAGDFSGTVQCHQLRLNPEPSWQRLRYHALPAPGQPINFAGQNLPLASHELAQRVFDFELNASGNGLMVWTNPDQKIMGQRLRNFMLQ